MQSIFPVNSSLLGPLNWCGHEVVRIKSALLRIYLPGCLPYPDSGTALAPTTAGSLAQRMREAGAYAWRCAQLTERKTCVTRCRSLIANCSGLEMFICGAWLARFADKRIRTSSPRTAMLNKHLRPGTMKDYTALMLVSSTSLAGPHLNCRRASQVGTSSDVLFKVWHIADNPPHNFRH